jgi:DNA-binding response OmpR family regulator
MQTIRPRVLAVDDDEQILDVVLFALEDQGFKPLSARDAETAVRMIGEAPPDLLILDINLPGRSGLDALRDLRQRHPSLPIILLTARGEEVDRVLGLELGADDYVTKPFSPRELVARVRALLRRSAAPSADSAAAWTHGPFRIDLADHRLTYFGEDAELKRGEFRIMERLLRHPARVFTRDALIDAIHEGEHFVTDRAVDACIKRLRRTFESIRPDLDPIETVYGVGYKLRHGIEDLR